MAEKGTLSLSKKKQLLVLFMMMFDEEECKHIQRKHWTRQWILRREERGAFNTIFKELALEDSGGFSEYTRMPHTKCGHIPC